MEDLPADARAYVCRLLEAYRTTPGTAGVVRRPDRILAAQLHQRGVALEAVENAFVCWWQRARGPKWQRREEPRCHWSMAAGAPAGWRVGAGSLIGRREFRMGFTQAVERQGKKANWLGEKERGRCPGLDDEPLRRTKLFLPTGLRVLRCCRRSSVGTALPHSSSTCGRTGPSRSLGHR